MRLNDYFSQTVHTFDCVDYTSDHSFSDCDAKYVREQLDQFCGEDYYPIWMTDSLYKASMGSSMYICWSIQGFLLFFFFSRFTELLNFEEMYQLQSLSSAEQVPPTLHPHQHQHRPPRHRGAPREHALRVSQLCWEVWCSGLIFLTTVLLNTECQYKLHLWQEMISPLQCLWLEPTWGCGWEWEDCKSFNLSSTIWDKIVVNHITLKMKNNKYCLATELHNFWTLPLSSDMFYTLPRWRNIIFWLRILKIW